MARPWTERTRLYAPPWLIISISTLLMTVVIIMGWLNYNREKTIMGKILNEKGAALIRSFEAGTRTGMMGMFGNEAHLRTLMEQTAAQPDLNYIVLSDEKGEILAHNDDTKIGETDPSYVFNDTFSPSLQPQWRMVKGSDGESIFEVYKRFLPSSRGGQNMGRMHRMHMNGPGKGHGRNRSSMECSPGWMENMPQNRILDPENRPAIIIGMDATPFLQAMSEDVRTNIIILILIFLLSVTGVVTLFWAQNLVKSRKLLQDTRAFASEIVANLPVGIVVVGENGRIVYINAVARDLLQVKGEPKGLLTASGILPPSIVDLHREVSTDKPVAEREINLDRKGRPAIPTTVSVTDVVNDEHQYLGFMVVIKDLSELRHLEREVRRREKLAAVGNLAAGIAHEVRNPLSSIKGYAAFLGSQFEPDSEQRKASEIMGGEVDRVNRVISELLEFARPSDLKRKSTAINELIRHGVKIVSHEAETKGVSVSTRIQPDIPAIDLDPDRMTQVMLNLLINAIEAMDQGGRLTVEAHVMDRVLAVDISDTGPGIPDEDVAHIFNPYFTRKKNGTGLGLAIVIKIVESHGGSVQVRSTPGKGTTMTVTLPLTHSKDAS